MKRNQAEIYFHKQKYECDFLVKRDLKISKAIQVTKTLKDPDVKKREYRGLLEAMQTYQLTERIILTMNEEEVEEFYEDKQKKQIKIIPIWKWLLRNQTKSLF